MRIWRFGVCAVAAVCFLVGSVAAKDYESIDELLADTAEVVQSSQEQGGGEPVATPEPTAAPQDVEAPDGGQLPAGPLEVIVLDTDELAAYSVTGSGYTGTISTTLLDYFAGVIAQNPRKDYVVFKADRYSTYLFYGDNFSYSGGVFSGRGSFVRYNSESQLFTRGTDSFSFADAGYYVYSNLDAAYPTLYQVEVVSYGKVVAIACGVALCLYAFDRIFFRRGGYLADR